MRSGQDLGEVRRCGRLLAGTFRQSEWVQASAPPAGGMLGLIVTNIVKGLAVVWRGRRDSSDESESLILWRPVIAFVIGGLSGWLLVTESSHLPIALAAATLAVAVTVSLLG